MAHPSLEHWRGLIRAAASQRDVVLAIQEYVVALCDDGQDCPEGMVLNDSSDVIDAALSLSRKDVALRPGAAGFDLTREMASLFGDASLRIASIAITAGEPIQSDGAWRAIPPAPWQRASNSSKY